MAPNVMECDICCYTFSEDNCPRILPCSHTFCGHCIDGIIATQKKTCPTCREEFTATSAEDLMINRIALDFVKQLSSMNIKPKTLSGRPKEFEEKLTKDSIAEVHEAETKRLEEMNDVSTGIKILSKMRESVIDTNKGIEGFMKGLQEIKLSNENTLDIINQNIKQLKKRMSLLLQEEGKTQDTDAKPEAATDSTPIGPVMDETEKVLEEGREIVKKHKELLREIERKGEDIIKEILRMRMQLGWVTDVMQVAFEKQTRVISAVKTIEGKQMVAPVRVKPRDQVRLSRFADGDIQSISVVIKHEALMSGSSRRAFLDLAVGGTFLARIVIKVMDEGNLALNFLHACAGDFGSSYANTQLSGVNRKGGAGEIIYMKEHKTSVLQIDWEKEVQREIYKCTPDKAGEVRAYLNEEASQFYIVTKDDPSRTHYISCCFGIVEEGLDALRDAISQYQDITDVQIVDCGLMFPRFPRFH